MLIPNTTIKIEPKLFFSSSVAVPSYTFVPFHFLLCFPSFLLDDHTLHILYLAHQRKMYFLSSLFLVFRYRVFSFLIIPKYLSLYIYQNRSYRTPATSVFLDYSLFLLSSRRSHCTHSQYFTLIFQSFCPQSFLFFPLLLIIFPFSFLPSLYTPVFLYQDLMSVSDLFLGFFLPLQTLSTPRSLLHPLKHI